MEFIVKFKKEGEKRVEDICNETNLSVREVLNNALSLYSLCLERDKEGYGVYLIKGEEIRQYFKERECLKALDIRKINLEKGIEVYHKK